ncbi:hypothetical protein QEH56_16130 [Pelagicoccus enzymogenes]|uniref:tetratricopeptide repeat protein n=1 Tax=Pelagicoccus enzymogenes TaxID=2773457 RepID=UPI00280EE8BA|nr:hypothetical protein [Pelagicoccus enzymogenes]MDQ8199691.1 hypothetical protein [Pelagicoccus enzymogenes]
MTDDNLSTKKLKLEQAWDLIQVGRFQASQRVLKSMQPEDQDSEGYHTMWLSTLIFAEEWPEVETYARKLVEQHGAFYLSAWHALIDGLCGQGKYAEAKAILDRAMANWPLDEILQAMDKNVATLASFDRRS